jgi:photosystem II stability/assembly factor-like uncharacterized protein
MRRVIVVLGALPAVIVAACGGSSIEYRYRCVACDAGCADAEAGVVTDAALIDAGLPPIVDAGPVVWRATSGWAGTPVAVRVGNEQMGARSLFVATDANGIFASSDYGATWSDLSDGLTNKHLVAMGLSDNNANSIFAVADRQFGSPYVAHTTDRGASWRGLTMTNPSGKDFDLATMFIQPASGQYFGGHDPTTGSAVVVTGFASGDYWTPHAIADATGTLRAITALTSNRVYGAVTGGNGGTGGVYRSYDGGGTWELASNGIDAARLKYVSALAGDPTDPLTVYAGIDAGGVVFKTSDGADTWLPTNSLPTNAGVLALAVRAAAPNEVYAGTTIGVYRSVDSGTTWSAYGLTGLRVVAIAIDPAAGNPRIIAAVTAPTPGIYVHDP